MSEFIGLAKVQTMRKDFDTLRRAIKSDHDIEAADDAWDKCERWLECIDATAADRITALEAENARLREALSLIAVVGFSQDPAVCAAIARQTVSQARAALEGGK